MNEKLDAVRAWAEDVVSHDIGYDADAGYYSAAIAVLRILDGKDPYGGD